jgi:hypothetical protein
MTEDRRGGIHEHFRKDLCPKFKAAFRSMEQSVDGKKLHREKYFVDRIDR